MKKALSILALLLCAIMLFAACADVTDPVDSNTTGSVNSESVAESESGSDSESGGGNNEAPASQPSIVKIYNAGQLLSIVSNSKSSDYAEKSKNIVYQLQADIDLNEGWSAAVTADGENITAMPSAPSTVWEGISKFYGTLDGNGKTIRGIYMYSNIEGATSMGFINELCGGTIKNLTVDNSFIFANVADGTQNVSVGALVGSVTSASVIENVTVNANVCLGGEVSADVGVAVGKKAEGMLTETALVEGGKVFRTSGDPNVIRVATAEELLAAVAEYGDFDGKTLRLTADIDLNPNWSAEVTIGDSIVFPEAPANIWTPISIFKGTFDGNCHILSGLYVTNTVSGNAGAYGGLFNTLDGGTVKNLAIVNSFILTTNEYQGAKAIHVGGIAGDVNGGSTLNTVVMDAEVWFKSDEQCMLGGAFGFANGVYTVTGYVFLGRVGNTNMEQAPNYATPSGKDIYIGQITGCQNHKSDATITDCLVGGVKYSGRDSSTTQHLGIDFPWTLKWVLVGKQDEAWLASRQDYAEQGFVYHAGVGSAVPGMVVELLDYVYGE